MTNHVSSRDSDKKLRVAHILRKYDVREWGGTETVLQNTISGLREHRVDSIVYAPELRQCQEISDPLRAQGALVRRFRAFLPMMGLSEVDRQALVAIGGNIVSLDAIWKLHRDRTIDVIHSHVLGRLGGLARMVARQKQIPFVLTIHGGYLDLPPAAADKLVSLGQRGIDYGKVFGFLLRSRHVVKDADAIITVNSREADLLREKFPEARIEVVPHGLSTSIYSQDHRKAAHVYLPAIQGRTIVLCVGRIDSIKNQQFLIEAFSKLRREVPNALLVLVGAPTDIDYDRRIRQRIHELNIEQAVALVGPLPLNDPRLIGLYQSAHVFVLPSLSETFGLVLLEAWAASCPVISSATSGAKQLVRNGENGFLFPPNDTDGLIQAVRQTFKSEERRKSLGEAGRKMVHAHYDSRVVARRVRHIYADLQANARRKSRIVTSTP